MRIGVGRLRLDMPLFGFFEIPNLAGAFRRVVLLM
jgi:hypothetical protein